MDWWSEDVFGNECWSIGLEKSGRTVNTTIKKESNELVEDNCSHEVINSVQNECSHEDGTDVRDYSSHEDDSDVDEYSSNGSVIILSSDSSTAPCDITFPKIKTEVIEEHLKKEYKEVTISEEQIVSETSEESNFLLAATISSKSFQTDHAKYTRKNLDSVKSTIFPVSTAGVQSSILFESKKLNQYNDFSGIIDQAGQPNEKIINIHNLIQSSKNSSLNITCSTDVGEFNQAIVNSFTCYMCKASYQNTCSLKQHFIHKHVTEYSIKDCKKKGVLNRKRRKMFSHAKSSKTDLFSHKKTLKKHIHTHTGEKPFSCSVCSANFSQKSILNTHMLTHTGEKPYSCSVCSAKFSHKSSLIEHLRTHTGEKPFSCSVCSAKFSRKSILNSHMRTHTGEKPFSCSVCSEKFSHKSHLNTHMRTHTGEKPFSCSVCSAKFSHKPHLNSHMSKHTGEKPFSCSVCSAKFSRKSHLNPHMRKHTGEKPFSCSVCGAKYSWKRSLDLHMLTHTGEKHFHVQCVVQNILGKQA
ncbi:oocyte zinc finger protein XlCOF6-like isoform X3 [Bacillus rossius redtenbacheri]|uniref:oocyte zinc finger protein XlCOF6-like isoform X3 n=1 Tax=Bacillus rossius redtenbacheri TaxID=93214 RepID=UPI002FDCF50D